MDDTELLVSTAPQGENTADLDITLPQAAPEILMTPNICVIGVGGAGGNAVNNMIEAKLNSVRFVVANTDAQVMANSLTRERIQLGATITQGLGAGSDPQIGKAAAEESQDKIKEILPVLLSNKCICIVREFFTELKLLTLFDTVIKLGMSPIADSPVVIYINEVNAPVIRSHSCDHLTGLFIYTIHGLSDLNLSGINGNDYYTDDNRADDSCHNDQNIFIELLIIISSRKVYRNNPYYITL